MTAARDEALARFTASGFPTTRDEEWRFTPVSPIVHDSVRRGRGCSRRREPRCAPTCSVTRVAAELVFVNGRFAPALSRTERSARRARRGGLACALVATRPRLVEPWLDAGVCAIRVRPSRRSTPPFSRTARSSRSRVTGHRAAGPRGLLSRPAAPQPAVAIRALLVVAGEHSQAPVIETLRRPRRRDVLHQHRDGILRRRRARCSITTACSARACRRYHVRHAGRAHRHARAVSRRTISSLGGAHRAQRRRRGARRRGRRLHAERPVSGRRRRARRQAHDHRSRACRTAAATSSTRASSAAEARGVFNGKIIVRQDAQKTDAKQTNKALLLSDDAQINTKPQLEIFADDVKCTHGATVGQLDPTRCSSTCRRAASRWRRPSAADPRVRGRHRQSRQVRAAARAARDGWLLAQIQTRRRCQRVQQVQQVRAPTASTP